MHDDGGSIVTTVVVVVAVVHTRICSDNPEGFNMNMHGDQKRIRGRSCTYISVGVRGFNLESLLNTSLDRVATTVSYIYIYIYEYVIEKYIIYVDQWTSKLKISTQVLCKIFSIIFEILFMTVY